MFNFIDMLFNFSEYLPATDCPLALHVLYFP